MRVRTALLVGAVLLVGLGLAGAATATPVDESDHKTNETTNESAGASVGICVTGVDSPCNGEQWDGDDNDAAEQDRSGGTDRGTAIDDSTTATRNSSADVGICVTGVDSPCNGEQWDGDDTARTDESVADGSSGSASAETDFDLGALVRLVGSVAVSLSLG